MKGPEIKSFRSATQILVAALLWMIVTTPAVTQENEINLDGSTPHGTWIENNMDEALIGNWRILQVQVEQNGQVMVFPNSGALLSILDSGSFKYDYSSETNGPRATDIVAGDFVSATTQTPVSTCKMVATGEMIGNLAAFWEEETGTMQNPEIRVVLNIAASSRPQVRCAGQSQVLGNMVTPSIGMGRPVTDASGQVYVSYSYILDRDNYTDSPNSFTDLEIWSNNDNPTRVRYFLRKE